MDGLKALKKQAVTTKLLQDTQAGKRIRALSKHTNANIAKLAAEVRCGGPLLGRPCALLLAEGCIPALCFAFPLCLHH